MYQPGVNKEDAAPAAVSAAPVDDEVLGMFFATSMVAAILTGVVDEKSSGWGGEAEKR